MADTINMSIDAKEPVREGTEDSMDTSTPEAETEIPQENAPGQQKRKGGRKPVGYRRYFTFYLL
jgi:hypothetical protein